MKISIYSIRHLKDITQQELSPVHVTRIFRICPECSLSACGEVENARFKDKIKT
jgi:hypothetical protein